MANYNVSITYKVKDETKAPIQGIKDNSKKAFSEVENNARGLSSSLGSVRSQLIGIGGALGVGFGLNSVINTRIEFEKFRAVLNNMEGSTAAGGETFERLKEFAKNTPSELSEVISSFIKLKSIGIEPTNRQMLALSDLAATMGKDIVQVTEAVTDASTGEFMRLKEAFNVVARVQNGSKTVAMTFRNNTTIIKNNSKAIQEYIFSLGQLKGIAGQSSNAMQTLGGVVSNMKDSVANASSQIGEALRPNIINATNLVNKLAVAVPSIIKFTNDWSVEIKGLALAFASFYIGGKVFNGITAINGQLAKGSILSRLFTGSMGASVWTAIGAAIIYASVQLWKYADGLREISKLNAKLSPAKTAEEIKKDRANLLEKYTNRSTLQGASKEVLGTDATNLLQQTELDIDKNKSNLILQAQTVDKLSKNIKELEAKTPTGIGAGGLYGGGISENTKLLLSNKEQYNQAKKQYELEQEALKNNVALQTELKKVIIPTLTKEGVITPNVPPTSNLGNDLTLTANGSNIKEVNISIKSLVEELNFNINNVKESQEVFKTQVIEMLNGVLADTMATIK